MARLIWLIQVVLVGVLWTCSHILSAMPIKFDVDLKSCNNAALVVADNFYGIINASNWNNTEAGQGCIIFLQKNTTGQIPKWKQWPQINESGSQLYLPKTLTKQNWSITVYTGNCTGRHTGVAKDCKKGNMQTSICKSSSYNETSCERKRFNDKYVLNMMTGSCINCDNPVKGPDEKIPLNLTEFSEDNKVDASQAAAVMKNMSNILLQMNGTSASVSLGEGIEGIIVKQEDPKEVEEVSFAYTSPAESIKIIEERSKLDAFSRAVTVSKEAFDRAMAANITEPFAAVFRFLNLTKDELNSSILENEVIAVEMGSTIQNLTDKISIHFKKFTKPEIPQCHSWDGEGDKPNWTDVGCETILKGDNITCRCTHLTFFAVLLTPLNETISSSDLNTLTIITQTGCGLSLFFLSIMFFMHFLLRKTKAGKATQILIQLALSMFMLNFTFLINNFVAGLNNPVACTIMAAAMHYSLLTTFSWFAVQAFHLWMQLHKGGRIEIHLYTLKVSVLTWVLPSIVAIVLIVLGKYSKQTINASNPDDSVAMCWINDNEVHYIVNIGYYVLVFLITFSLAIYILAWLFCLKKANMSSKQGSQNGKNIIIILGLCCVLGITWGFAFLAYGAIRLPGLYIFTILNSFQGFFLFIYYYYNNRYPGGQNSSQSNQKSVQSTSSTSTLNTFLETLENPYRDPPPKK